MVYKTFFYIINILNAFFEKCFLITKSNYKNIFVKYVTIVVSV